MARRALVLALILAPPARATDPAGVAFFEAKVRPLLIERCLSCHGGKKQKGELRLDSKAGWEKGGESGPAVVPGKPDESRLVRAVRYADVNLQMPPDKKLPAAEVAILEQWVRMGAPDPRTEVRPGQARPLAVPSADWWSLRPPQRGQIPSTKHQIPTNPIDAFVVAKLAEKGLSLSPEADRRTLIRRLTFNLHGLPPTPEEVEAFVADRDPEAYPRLVDRLLASPRYGERWARHWLDAIHFAETHGAEHDMIRPHAWRYRDYVIDALNKDTPYSRFIREQLAPDVFFPAEPQLTVGLGFLAAGPFDQSTAATAPETFLYLDRDDMLTQTLSTFASATVHCARCHDHKFDPIPQSDYYALQAVFAGVGRGDVPFDADPTVGKARRNFQRLAAAADARDPAVLLSPAAAEWEKAIGQTGTWHPLAAETFVSLNGAKLTRNADGSVTAGGPRPDVDTYAVTAALPIREVLALRLDVLDDPTLPMRGPGRQDNGNLHLSEVEVTAFEPGVAEGRKVKLKRAVADFDQTGWTIAHAIDGNPKTAWGIFPEVGRPHAAVFHFAEPVKLGEGGRLVVSLKQLHGGGHLIGKFKLSVSADPAATVVPLAVSDALRVPPDQRTRDQRLTVAAFAAKQHADAGLAKLPAPQFVYAGAPNFIPDQQPKPVTTPRPVHVLARGDLAKKGAEARPGALSVVTALKGKFDNLKPEDEAGRRAALADWLAAPENPLTWRSIVNRVWHHHFGRGIVDTPNDFGRMGSLPSHPELLDWLAVEFRDNGQSLKKLHRLIVTSAAYKQAARTDAKATALDADNRFLWRAPRRRLDAESYRDAVLQVSGRLDLTAGGPSVQQFTTSKGPQNTPNVDYTKFDWDAPGAGRRSVYRLVYRTIPDPFLDALDFPDAALLAPTRGFSASSLQALALLNNQFVLRHSEHAAARAAKLPPDPVTAAFRLAFHRAPTAAERAAFAAYADRHGAANLWRVLFNSNEFLFLD